VLLNAAAPMPCLQSFAQWLARHAGLVKSISMKPPWSHIKDIDGLPYKAHLAAAQDLLQLSIQAAGAPPAESMRWSTPSPAAAAAAATTVTDGIQEGSSQQQQQQQQGLRLRNFSSSLPKAVDVLAALQVQHLTRVELRFLNDGTTDSFGLSMALARLSNL
jgi:hypothetical protein